MCVTVKYLMQQCKLFLNLDHDNPEDFYISVWQTTYSPVPLLLWRILLFLISLAMATVTIVLYVGDAFPLEDWFDHFTRWGLAIMLLCTGFAVVTSVLASLCGTVRAEENLPWYMKIYWLLHNIAVPVAFLNTVFFMIPWEYRENALDEIEPQLDMAIYIVNTLVVLGLHMTASHPTHGRHVIQPVLFTLAYVVYSVIFYLTNGLNPANNPWIDPALNWDDPGTSTVVVLLAGVLIITLHYFAIALASARHAIASCLIRPSVTNQHNGYNRIE